MAATQAVAATAPPPATDEKSAVVDKTEEKLVRVEKPDEDKFKRDLTNAEKQLSAVQDKIAALKIKLDGSSGKGPNSARLAELRAQLDSIKEKQASLKSGKSGIQQQLDTLKAKIEREQGDLKTKRGKLQYRSTDEIDREIKSLESDVDSGKLKLVDEKKNLKKMTELRALKKQLSVHTVAEESIKQDIQKRKALQDELQSSTSTPAAKALSEEYNKVREEMNRIKEENDEVFAKRGELRGQRDELQKERDRAYEAKKEVQDEYYKQRDAYRAWNDHNRKAQSEKYWKMREEEERAKIQSITAHRLEESTEDAFATEIWKCENLLRLFGGGAGPAEPAPKSATPAIPAAPAARTVETTGLTKLTSKKDRNSDDLFSPPSAKKKTKAPTAAKPKQKGFVLSMDVMKTLGELGVVLPTSEDATKETVEELKSKLAYYKENQTRVTQDNIAKAKRDNEEFERKLLASFFEKKEADLSGRKNVPANRGRKGPAAGGERKPRKINGNHSPDAKEEPAKEEPSLAEEPVAATEEKEGAEEGS